MKKIGTIWKKAMILFIIFKGDEIPSQVCPDEEEDSESDEEEEEEQREEKMSEDESDDEEDSEVFFLSLILCHVILFFIYIKVSIRVC